MMIKAQGLTPHIVHLQSAQVCLLGIDPAVAITVRCEHAVAIMPTYIMGCRMCDSLEPVFVLFTLML